MAKALHNSPFTGSQQVNERSSGGKIFLIGFMGSGKSYWGKKWAQQYGFDFYDLDQLIEAEHNKTIATIFENDGEDIFRQMETVELKKLAAKDKCIIACGGGTACYDNNMQWMNEQGVTAYLQASPQYIYERVLEETEKRPLIKKVSRAELLFFIEQKLKEREGFYNQATIILPVQDLDDNFEPEFISKPARR